MGIKILILIICLCGTCHAEQYKVSARTVDLNPNDGFMDAGSSVNPYVITDSRGREVGTMRSQVVDIVPKDGFMDAGSSVNPFIMED